MDTIHNPGGEDNVRMDMMRNGTIPSALLRLGLPTMVSMLVSALYNLVDAWFVSGLGASEVGAVSVAFPIGQIMVGVGLTFGSGAASYISRLLGQGNTQQAHTTASTALFSSLGIGTVIIAAVLIFLDPLLTALGATATILPFARQYAFIYITGSLFSIYNVTLNNIINAEGATRLTMTAGLVGAGLNMLLDPLFIYTFDLGIRGAAIATVISLAVNASVLTWFVLAKKGVLRISPHRFRPKKIIYGETFKVGIPVFVFQALTSVSMGMTNAAASVYGDAVVAAVGIVTRILTIGNFIVFGYAKGFQVFVGFNYGAKQYDRVRAAIRTSLIWSSIFCGAVAMAALLFAPSLLSLFIKGQSDYLNTGSLLLRVNAVVFIFSGFFMIYACAFLAFGKGKEGGILSIIGRQGIFFIPAILLLPAFFGLNGIIYAQPVSGILSVAVTAFLAVRFHKEIKVRS